MLILKKIGWALYDAGAWFVRNWKFTVPAVVILIVLIFVYRACSRPKPIDEAKIQEAIKAIEEKNDAKLKEILVDADVKEQQIDANVAEGRKQTMEAANTAREKYANMNTSDLAAELEKRK